MLAVSTLASTRRDEEMESFNSIGASLKDDEFAELSEASLLESINFDDLFVGINIDEDVLPDLEMDIDIFAEFSMDIPTSTISGDGSREESSIENCFGKDNELNTNSKKNEEYIVEKTKDQLGFSQDSEKSRGEEIVNERDDSIVVNPPTKDGGKGRKSSSQSKNNNPQGKIRKVKVDWTPELHRRFVQAVEQLGVDKAVPSRILEIMGIDCLTRHNIASHLQKYRSHRKHLLAREAEAANWNQRRHIYGGGGGGLGKRDMNPWLPPPPTMGFPPITSMHHFRPLHVWGHPSIDQSFIHMWPKNPTHSPSPRRPSPRPWVPPAGPLPLPPDPSSFWHPQHQPAPNTLTAGTPCFPQPLTTTRYGPPAMAGIIPATAAHGMYKAADSTINGVSSSNPIFDFHPSKESIDAAIGDVLAKPWQPLPLGLKAPALDSVLTELQRQGIPNIPPSCA
ncbi:glucokinase [Stylosanthes scabra]|uniref:Glucokinase n=1 Tax=Stylosanthes scabra TaxID=79078 RepID=A0ABU6SA32_9FABA|nr:glucokinase [Stylosanthes scabra]